MADCPHNGLSFLVWANMTSTQAHKKTASAWNRDGLFTDNIHACFFFLHDHIAMAEALNASRECL